MQKSFDYNKKLVDSSCIRYDLIIKNLRIKKTKNSEINIKNKNKK
jgi:hypothetical protein